MTREWRWSIQSREGAEEKKGKKKKKEKMVEGGSISLAITWGEAMGTTTYMALTSPYCRP